MIVSLIAAVDENNGIGKDGRLPWKISSDLKRFKNLTMGHHIIMGRKTWDTIGSALPSRTNIILSRNLSHTPANTILQGSLELALDFAAHRNETEAFVIGGGQIFAEALPFAHRIYLSKVHAILPADVYFPSLDPEAWIIRKSEELPASERDQYAYTFMILERRNERAIV